MADDEVWLAEKYVRPRLSRKELWALYRLIDDKYWLLRRGEVPLWGFREVSRLRLKILRNLNRIRKPEY